MAYTFSGAREMKPKNPMMKNDGFQAMQKRLAGAKMNKPMKMPMARPKTSSSFVKSAT
jgi:hypothetical protein